MRTKNLNHFLEKTGNVNIDAMSPIINIFIVVNEVPSETDLEFLRSSHAQQSSLHLSSLSTHHHRQRIRSVHDIQRVIKRLGTTAACPE